MDEVKEPGIDGRHKRTVRWSIENEEFTDRIKLPKERTDAEMKQASKSFRQASIKETQKFCQIVSLPEKIETVITPAVFFARSSDPVVPEVKKIIKNEFFDELNIPIALNFNRKYNIINVKNRKVALSSESMKQLKLENIRFNKYIEDKEPELSKPEKKLDQLEKLQMCIEAASKIKRVKHDPVGLQYQGVYHPLFPGQRMKLCPNSFKTQIEIMVDLRFDFDYENRPYYKERKLIGEKLKKETRPPIKLKISIPRKKSSEELAAVSVKKPTKTPPEVIKKASSTSSSCTSVVESISRKSITPDFENAPYKNSLAALPKIPLKPRTDDPLKKSDQGNVQTGRTTIEHEISEEERLRILKEKAKEKKEKEKKEAEEKRRRKEEKERKEEQRKEQERIRIKNLEESKRIEEQKRREKEDVERVLKEQEEAERRRLRNEEMEKARNPVRTSMNHVTVHDKMKELREKNVLKLKSKAGMESTSRNVEAEPPAKQMKLDRPPRPESAPRDEFYVEDERTKAISNVTDNSFFPTAIATVAETGISAKTSEYFTPKVKKPKYTEGEKTRLFQQYYQYQNYSSAPFDIKKNLDDFRKNHQTVICDEDGPLKDVQLDRMQRNLMKNLESLHGLEDIEVDDLECVDEWSEGEQRGPNSLKEIKVWDYSKFSVFTLLKKYEWPFKRTSGIVWPVVVPSLRYKYCGDYIRTLLAYRSCSGKLLSDILCINEPSGDSEEEKFLKAYNIAGEDYDSIDEQNQYFLSQNGRFANRNNYVRVETDQTKEDGSRKHMERYQRECEMEDRYLASTNGRNDGSKNSCIRKELINTYVTASRIDVYSVRDKSHSKHEVGRREKTTYPEWTRSGYHGFLWEARDKAFVFEINEMTKYYDSQLRHMNPVEHELWCTSPLLASMYFASSYKLAKSFLPADELTDIRATKLRFRKMCLSTDVNQTKLSSMEHICKLTETEKASWNILLNNLLTCFKDLPSLPQILDRPIYSRTLNSAYQEVLQRSKH